jgi:recombination protein RecA
MARGKASSETKAETDGSAFDAFIKKEFGDGIIVPASAISERPRAIIPTCLSLDVALTGGIPEGKVVLISGLPKAGKTTLSLHILGNAILMGRKAFYANIERRFDPALLSTIPHVDPTQLMIQNSTRENSLSAEGWFNLLERTIKDNPGCVQVVDSLAMLSTLAEQSEATGDYRDMAGTSKLAARFFRKIKDVVDTNNCILIFITHFQTNRDPQSRRKYDEKGGMGIQYACSVWLQADWVEVWQRDPQTNERYGQNVKMTIKTSALGKPFRPCSIPLVYGGGIDVAREVAAFGENLGLIEKSGAWYTIPAFDQKFQGLEAVRAFLLQNPAKRFALEREIRQIVIPNSVPYADQIAERVVGAHRAGPVPEKAQE